MSRVIQPIKKAIESGNDLLIEGRQMYISYISTTTEHPHLYDEPEGPWHEVHFKYRAPETDWERNSNQNGGEGTYLFHDNDKITVIIND